MINFPVQIEILVNGMPAVKVPNGDWLIPHGARYSIRFRNLSKELTAICLSELKVGGQWVMNDDVSLSLAPGEVFDMHKPENGDGYFTWLDAGSAEYRGMGYDPSEAAWRNKIDCKFRVGIYPEDVYQTGDIRAKSIGAANRSATRGGATVQSGNAPAYHYGTIRRGFEELFDVMLYAHLATGFPTPSYRQL